MFRRERRVVFFEFAGECDTTIGCDARALELVEAVIVVAAGQRLVSSADDFDWVTGLDREHACRLGLRGGIIRVKACTDERGLAAAIADLGERDEVAGLGD